MGGMGGISGGEETPGMGGIGGISGGAGEAPAWWQAASQWPAPGGIGGIGGNGR